MRAAGLLVSFLVPTLAANGATASPDARSTTDECRGASELLSQLGKLIDECGTIKNDACVEALRRRDRRLARRIARFWKSSPQSLLVAAECLGRLYHQKENDRLREPIIEALLQIDVMTADEAGNNPVMEFVYLEVISKSDNDEHRLAVLDRLPAAMYSEKTSRTLLSLSQGRDMESPLVKEKEIGLLAMSACQREADPDVMAYLAQVAKGDPCTGCQRAAITSDLVLRDKKTFWPVYRELLSRPETAETTVEAVAAHARLPESVPLLIGMLDTKDPALGHTIAFGLSRATGVSSQALGLEYVMNERVALRGLLSGYSEHAEQEAVENLKSTWRSWWEQHGDDFLERHGLSK